MDTVRTPVEINTEKILQEGMPEYERGQRLKDRVVNVDNYLCIERARIITKAYMETEREHVLIRRGHAIKKILSEMSVYILDDELIVGHQAGKQRSAPIFPELGIEWIEEEIDMFQTRPQDNFIVTDEFKKEFMEEILPYWKGKTLFDRMQSYIPEDVALQRYDANVFSVGLHEDGGLGHCYIDYEKALVKGLDGIRKEIEAEMAKLEPWKSEDYQKNLFYKSAIMHIEAVEIFANRYADLAEKMSGETDDSKRKEELLRIASICRKVPMQPASCFYEALQSFWFIQLVPQIYDNGVSISPGRFDQYMYPFYKADLEKGVITKIQAQEVLEALWVKFTEPIKVYRAADAAFHAGYPMGQNLSIGGLKPDGEDSTNDLSYRCLEAHSHMILMQPNFSVRLHKRSPHMFLRKTVEAIKCGNGMPQIMNDAVWIPALMNIGLPIEEARDYQMIGCVECGAKNSWVRANGGYFNLTKVVELAMNNGKCRVTGVQAGPFTGEAESFETYEQFLEAVKVQMEYSVKELVYLDNLIDRVHEECLPVPFNSILINDSIANGKDVTSGGARYNWTGTLGVGIANAGDSLAAIKKLVYEENQFSLGELNEIMNNDYKDAEDVRLILQNKVPKYGNDEEYADECVRKITSIFFDAHKNYETYRGGPFVPGLLPVASYVAFGAATGATPDGRKKFEPLADGISPSNGVDLKGPTAVLNSVTKIDHKRSLNGVILNQKINPKELESEAGIERFMNLVKTYLDLEGGHIQFNIMSSDMLRDAQKTPDKYRGLVVRVAGYSAFFNELAPEVQESIIERTEQEL